MDWSISLAFRNKLFIVFSRKWAICDSLMNMCSWLHSHMLFLDGRHVLTWCSPESLLWCGITCAPMAAILLTLAWLINFKYSIFDHHSSRKNSPSLSLMGERNYTQGTRLINPQEWQDSESHKIFDYASIMFIGGKVSLENMSNLPHD